MQVPTLAAGLVIGMVLAGCVAETEPNALAGGPEVDVDDARYVSGLVMDPELVPLADAVVTVTGREGTVVTDASGAFTVGPLEPGTYTVAAEKLGYGGAS